MPFCSRFIGSTPPPPPLPHYPVSLRKQAVPATQGEERLGVMVEGALIADGGRIEPGNATPKKIVIDMGSNSASSNNTLNGFLVLSIETPPPPPRKIEEFLFLQGNFANI
jgi:hypothetical protein